MKQATLSALIGMAFGILLFACIQTSAFADQIPYDQGIYDDNTNTYTITKSTLAISDINAIHSVVDHGDTIYFPAGVYLLDLDGGATSMNNRAWTVSKNLNFRGELIDGELASTIKWGGLAAGNTYMFTVGAPSAANAVPGNLFQVTFQDLIFDGRTEGGTAVVRSALNFLNQTSGTNRKDSDFRVTNCVIQNTNTLLYRSIVVNQAHLTVDGLTTISSGSSAIELCKGSGTQQNDAELVLVGRGIASTSNRGSFIFVSDIPEAEPQRYHIDNSAVSSGPSGLLFRTGNPALGSTGSRSYFPLPELAITLSPTAFAFAPTDADDLAYTGTDLSLDFTADGDSLGIARAAGVTWPSAISWPARGVHIVITATDSDDILYVGSTLTSVNVLNSGSLADSFTLGGTYKGEPLAYDNYPDQLTLAIIDVNENVLPLVVCGSTTTSDIAGLVYATASIGLTIDPPIFTLSFDANGGTGELPPNAMLAVGSEYEVPPPSDLEPPTGQQFGGWNSSADGSGIEYEAGATLTMPAQNLTLFAIWQDLPTDIEYSISEGADGSWQSGSTFGYQITSDGAFTKNMGIRLGDAWLKPTDYLAVASVATSPGSNEPGTVVTLLPEFLQSLAPGSYSVELAFTDGNAVTELIILADDSGTIDPPANPTNPTNPTTPPTGDGRLSITLASGMLFVAGLITLITRRRRIGFIDKGTVPLSILIGVFLAVRSLFNNLAGLSYLNSSMVTDDWNTLAYLLSFRP